ncbi:MAG: PAS domain S-box protein [Microcoleus vaginatus WJT46-NPBG5]|jgi:PAS domain S-box-containing protein|nr:PAS domain S-box protein [Microcoleus vaginatus WJT46-NPBG5]
MTDRPPSHSVFSEKRFPQTRPPILFEADVLITAVLAERSARQPDLAAENQALATLAQQLTDDPQSRLKTLVQITRDLCQAGTVGVSLLETLPDDTSVFRRVAIAGLLESWEQTAAPSNFSPCGTTIGCRQPQLYARPERYFTYLHQSQFPIVEGLLIPICVNDQPLGTLWIVSHTEQRAFDREDIRLMTSLAGFAAAALQSMHLHQTAALALQAEQALQESEAFNHSVFESSADCIKVLDINGCFLSMNSPGRCLMEVEDCTLLVGTDWVKFWPDCDRANAAQAVTTAQAGGKGQFSGYCPTLKGTPKWWDVVVTPILDVLGKPKQLLVVSRDITERKRTEQRLRQSEEQSRNILGSITDGFFALNSQWQIVYVNQAAELLLDRTLQDLLGKNFWQEYPGVIGSELESIYWGAMRDRVVGTWTGFYPDHDRWYEVRAYPAPDGITAYFRNITDQIQAQAALQEQTQLMQLIIDSIGDGLVMANLQGEIVIVNEAAERIFGSITNERSCEEWSRTYGLFLPDQQTLFPDQQLPLYRAMQGEAANDVEVFVRRDPTCEGRWVSISGFPVRKMNREITGGVITCRDITDRKQTEAALRESEERFRTLADQMSQLAWMADTNGWIFWYNRRWFECTGTTLEAMQGWGWQQVHHPEHVDRVVEHFRYCLEAGEEWEDTFPLRSKDGTYRWFLSRAIPIRDAAGNILRWFGTNTDITERLEAEKEREQLLKQEQTAREAAEQANRLKDEFLAVLSHELRSPLNPILGWAQLLRGGRLNSVKTAEALATIERNAKLQCQLIEDLLDISRIMQGKLMLNAAPVSLAFVISSAIETVRLAAKAKNISIETYLEPNIRQVYGDAGRLQQVVWNLLSNAVKFTATGGRVEVRLAQAGHHVLLQVSDTGKGISSEFLPYVFEHFRQEDGATTRKFGGLGLGLAIASQIVNLHGGRIWVESLGEAQGATFTVELPFSQTVNPVEEVTDSVMVQADHLVLANLRVLLVDDDPDSREFVVFVMEQAGAEVTAVSSAIEALQRLSTTPFDLLLSDIGMPEMDGYELMHQISPASSERGGQVPAIAQPVSLPAIALTAYAGEMNQQRALAAGFQGHITKPVEPDKLIKTIVTIMTRIGAKAELT